MPKLVAFLMVFVLGLSAGVFVTFFLQNESITITEPPSVEDHHPGPAGVDRSEARRTHSERPLPTAEIPLLESGLDIPELPPIPLLNESGERFRIEGRVVDPSGRPVSGVLIRCEVNLDNSELPAALLNPMPGVPLDTVSERHFQSLLARRTIHARTRVEATSDDNGRFVLENLYNEREYRVSGYRTGFYIYKTLRGNAFVTIGAKSPAIVLVAWPAHRVRCHVEFDNGQPLDRAIIYISNAVRHMEPWTWTREAPDIWLVEGTLKIRAVLAGEYDAASRERYLKVPLPENEQPVVLNIPRATGIELTVQTAPDDPLQEFRVAAAFAPDSNTPAEEILRRAEQNAWMIDQGPTHRIFGFADLSGQEPTHRFTGLKPGRWIIGLRVGTKVLQSTTVEVKKAFMVPVTLKMPDRNPADHVVVRVLDPDGRLTQDAQLEVDPFLTTKRLDGSFWVSKKPISEEHLNEKSTEFAMTISTSSYGEKKIPFLPDGPAEITVRLEAPAEVRLRIEGYVASGPAPHYQMSMALSDASNGLAISHEQRLEFDHTEDYWTAVTQPGIARIIVSVSGEDRAEWITADVIEHTLRPGRNEITLSPPTLSTLTILFEDERKHATVNVSKHFDEWNMSGRQIAVANSKAMVSFLPHGRYSLALSNTEDSPAQESMTVDITGPVTVRWKTIHRNALKMRFLSDHLPLRLAGFRDGDIVVGADGEEWAQEPADSFWGLLRYKKKVRFQVLRLGKFLDLDVDCIPLRDLGIYQFTEEIERP